MRDSDGVYEILFVLHHIYTHSHYAVKCIVLACFLHAVEQNNLNLNEN